MAWTEKWIRNQCEILFCTKTTYPLFSLLARAAEKCRVSPWTHNKPRELHSIGKGMLVCNTVPAHPFLNTFNHKSTTITSAMMLVITFLQTHVEMLHTYMSEGHPYQFNIAYTYEEMSWKSRMFLLELFTKALLSFPSHHKITAFNVSTVANEKRKVLYYKSHARVEKITPAEGVVCGKLLSTLPHQQC